MQKGYWSTLKNNPKVEEEKGITVQQKINKQLTHPQAGLPNLQPSQILSIKHGLNLGQINIDNDFTFGLSHPFPLYNTVDSAVLREKEDLNRGIVYLYL
jgi:hypothetical protein